MEVGTLIVADQTVCYFRIICYVPQFLICIVSAREAGASAPECSILIIRSKLAVSPARSVVTVGQGKNTSCSQHVYGSSKSYDGAHILAYSLKPPPNGRTKRIRNIWHATCNSCVCHWTIYTAFALSIAV